MKVLWISVCFVFLCALVLFAQESQTQSQPQTRTQTQASQGNISRVLETQIWLDRRNYSPGEIDGKLGKNTQMALHTYRQENDLAMNSKIDDQTLDLLREPGTTPLTNYTITEKDVDGPYVDQIPDDYMEQSKMQSLGFTSELEALGEKFHCSPALLRKLNPQSEFFVGSEIRVPNVAGDENHDPENNGKLQKVRGKGTQKSSTSAGSVSIVVSKEKSQLLVQDDSGKTLFAAPITAGSDDYPYPYGSWKVTGVSWKPHFEYDPSLFQDASPADTKTKLPSGPNSPVGVVWIDLTVEHYGIHGTPNPGYIGYSESHGCIRLTNWDAVKVARMVKPGTNVTFQ
jgi:lipoprotein-anchoring transpeptidase ErfK/SrfK